jgi:hypothetical protein
VRKVLKRQPTRTIMVFVDMKDVNHAAKKVHAANFKCNKIHAYYTIEGYIWRLEE